MDLSPLNLMDDCKSVFGVNLGHMWEEVDILREWMAIILDGTQSWARPHIDKVFCFDQVAAAHEYIEGRKNIGKVILVPKKEQVDEWDSKK